MHVRAFENTFPFGFANSKYLTEQMIHIQLAAFSSARQLQRLIEEFREAAQDMAWLTEKASAASLS
jgi:hypothetical protein